MIFEIDQYKKVSNIVILFLHSAFLRWTDRTSESGGFHEKVIAYAVYTVLHVCGRFRFHQGGRGRHIHAG